jgi:hypothetical protein
MDTLRLVVGWAALIFMALLGLYLLWGIYTGNISLKHVISDKDYDASMGRFQILIFTFVVALSFLYFVTSPQATGFPEVPGSVLTLLGISGSAYLISKGIDGPAEDGKKAPTEGKKPASDENKD